MRVLAVADDEAKSLYDYYTPGKLADFDLIISCGDLSRHYLEFLVTMARCPLVYVRGNHDDKLLVEPPEGCVCVDGEAVKINGLRILGLGGSYRYRRGENMYTEEEMEKRVRKLRFKLRRIGGVDIIVTHAPARHINDFDSMSHRGFECFNDLLDKYEPKYFVHGHIHKNYGVNIPQRTQHGQTTIINAYEKCEFEI